MDILPHQLEPAVAVLRGDGCRILLADEVGLGKTIQACVLIAELRAKGHAGRVLVLTPPGLRDQWQHELSRRFHIDAVIADFRTVRRQAHLGVVYVDWVSLLYAHPCAMGEVRAARSVTTRSDSRSPLRQEVHQAVQPQ